MFIDPLREILNAHVVVGNLRQWQADQIYWNIRKCLDEEQGIKDRQLIDC